tara:strand:+ start:2434 stop:2592 length:159 start_codon:yes stop_codon:yes gene_type:complete
MKYSLECMCGFETPLVEDKTMVDWGMMDNHQQWCKTYQKVVLRRKEQMGDEQ